MFLVGQKAHRSFPRPYSGRMTGARYASPVPNPIFLPISVTCKVVSQLEKHQKGIFGVHHERHGAARIPPQGINKRDVRSAYVVEVRYSKRVVFEKFLSQRACHEETHARFRVLLIFTRRSFTLATIM